MSIKMAGSEVIIQEKAIPTPSESASGGYFVQVPVELLKQESLSPAALKLYLILLSYTGKGEFAWPGQERLAKDMGLSDRRVRSLIDELEENKLLVVSRRPSKTNLYQLYRFKLKSMQEVGIEATDDLVEEENFRRKRKESSGRTGLNRKKTSHESHAESKESHEKDTHAERVAYVDNVCGNTSCSQPIEKESETLPPVTDKSQIKENNKLNQIKEALELAGIWQSTAEKLALTAISNGRDAGYIAFLNEWVKQQKNVANPAAYLVALIKQNIEPSLTALNKTESKGGKEKKTPGMVDWSKYGPGGKYAFLSGNC